uniref:Chromo domain-containing protein n=1 Tax=Panagrolaimus superbus TaxID=310955 RepID=A0A914YKH3_9BILA
MVLVTYEKQFKVEDILAMRVHENGNVWFLIKWAGYPDDHNSWEPASHLTNSSLLVFEFMEELIHAVMDQVHGTHDHNNN